MRPFRVEAPNPREVCPYFGGNGLKSYCRLMGSDEWQELIEGLERAAVEYLDGYDGRLGRCILRQKWAFPLEACSEMVFLPFPDCREFKVEQLAGDTWSEIDGVNIEPSIDAVLLSDLPSDITGLHLTCYAGWETVSDVPENLKQAIRFLVAHWFENRSAVSASDKTGEVPLGFRAMIAPLVHVFA